MTRQIFGINTHRMKVSDSEDEEIKICSMRKYSQEKTYTEEINRSAPNGYYICMEATSKSQLIFNIFKIY